MSKMDDEFAVAGYNTHDTHNNIQQQQHHNTFNHTSTQQFDEALEISDHSQNDLTEASYDNTNTNNNLMQQQSIQRPASGISSQQQNSNNTNRPNSSLQQQRPGSSRQPIQQHIDEHNESDLHHDNDTNTIEHKTLHSDGPQQIELYDANEYTYLNQAVSKEITDLFAYIPRYTPHDIDLISPLRPFIPDYIPAVGEIDQFLKLLPPIGISGVAECDRLGLSVLDEPSATQSDSNVLDLRLRVMSKNIVNTPLTVVSIPNASENTKKIDKWIQSIVELHHDKPSTSIDYTYRMPSIDELMDVWPNEIEQLLQHANITLPSNNIELTPIEYSKVICALLDIPVFKDKLIESLHLLFSLYQGFNHNAHFQSV